MLHPLSKTFKRLVKCILCITLCCSLSAQTSSNSAPATSTPNSHAEKQSIVPQKNVSSKRIAPTRPQQAHIGQTRTLAGQFVRVISRFGPRYPIRLLDEKNKRLAYVDLSNLFIRDLRPYLNNPVKISGEVRPLVPGSEELVIVARTLQLRKSGQALPYINDVN